jgi:hypothetical protein
MPYGFSLVRKVAALLDAHGAPLPVAEVNRVIGKLTGRAVDFASEPRRSWRSDLVKLTPDGRLMLDSASPDLVPMRRAVRQLAGPAIAARARQEHWQRARERFEREYIARHEKEAKEAKGLRRAVIRALPDPAHGPPVGVALLDIGARRVRTFMDGELGELAEALGRYDLLAGLHVRDVLHGLGLDPDCWRLVDLKPPKKTSRFGKRGRALRLTPAMVISSTTGIEQPLGDATKVARYLAAGDRKKLAQRLEADVKVFYALYHYGVTHRCVLLHRGFVDELLHVEWAHPGDPNIQRILREAAGAGAEVEVVLGSAPSWEAPWARSRRCRVKVIDDWVFELGFEGEVRRVDACDVQAVRGVG